MKQIANNEGDNLKEVITAAEELSLGPEENEFPALSAAADADEHLSQQVIAPAGVDEESPIENVGEAIDETDRDASSHSNLMEAVVAQSSSRESKSSSFHIYHGVSSFHAPRPISAWNSASISFVESSLPWIIKSLFP